MSWWLVGAAVGGFFLAGPFWLVIFALASAERYGGYIEPGRKR